VMVCGLALPVRGKEADPRGAVGALGGGALAPSDNVELASIARDRGVALQAVPADRFQFRKPAGWDGSVVLAAVPVLFAQTPVETVDLRDVVSLAQLAAGILATPGPGPIDAEPISPPSTRAASSTGSGPLSTSDAMKAMVEAYGVSGHEAAARDTVLRLIPRVAAWAKPEVDERGNVAVTFGAGGDEMVFVAHTDELGYEITNIRDDGTATVRARGGMYDSLYEGHPVIVHTATGQVPAVIAPRTGYLAADTGSPRIDDLCLYFGAATAADVRALGVATADAATVRKRFTPLAGARSTSRSMDDRAGCAALLMALSKIDPSKAGSKVTFLWSVGEEIGLVGASYVAAKSKAKYAFAVDTFVSTDSPFDTKRLAVNKLGSGAVLRGMDNSTSTPLEVMDRLVELARQKAIPMTIGVTAGGTDASAFSRYGAVDVGLSWPGRYSHSPVEVTDRRDIDALVNLVVAVATTKW
jgi:putative aminopeptidase FrvX